MIRLPLDFPESRRRESRAWTYPSVLALPLVVVAIGCGTGTYKARMEDRLEELKRESPFLLYLERDEYPVTDEAVNQLGVFIRPPKQFFSQGQGIRAGHKDSDGVPIAPDRVQPPFLKFRDHCLTYEWFNRVVPQDWQNPNMPVYFYIAVTDARSPDGERVDVQPLLDDIQQQINTAFRSGGDAKPADAADAGAEAGADAEVDADVEDTAPAATSGDLAEWEDLSPATPAGGTIALKRLRIEGPMLFDCTPQGGQRQNHDGLFDVYVHSDDTYHVVIAWRAPVRVDNMIRLMDAAKVSMASLRIDPSQRQVPDEAPVEEADDS